MTALAIVAVSCTYAILGLGVGRALAGHLAYRMAESAESKYSSLHRGNTDHPYVGQWLGAWMMALPLLAIWPLALAVVGFTRLVPRVGAEAKGLRRVQAARIRELERELNIR